MNGGGHWRGGVGLGLGRTQRVGDGDGDDGGAVREIRGTAAGATPMGRLDGGVRHATCGYGPLWHVQRAACPMPAPATAHLAARCNGASRIQSRARARRVALIRVPTCARVIQHHVYHAYTGRRVPRGAMRFASLRALRGHVRLLRSWRRGGGETTRAETQTRCAAASATVLPACSRSR